MSEGELKRALAREVRMVYRFACAEPAFWGLLFPEGIANLSGFGDEDFGAVWA